MVRLISGVAGLLALVFALAAASTFAAVVDSSFVVRAITRKINLATPHGLENIVGFQVAKKSGASVFRIPLSSEGRAGRLSRVSCTVDNNFVKDVTVDKGADAITVNVALPETFTSGTIACQMVRVGNGARRPYPAEITQLEKQRYLFESQPVRVQTSYALEGEETTEIVFPRGRIDLLEEIPGVAMTGNRVSAGPFKKTATEEEMSKFFKIQYDAAYAVPVFKYVEREIEISHWGNIAVEEQFDLYNDGAKLKGEFSRLDHQTHNVPHAFQTVHATIPSDAWGVYYRDELGNVTTSNMWKPRNKKQTDLTLKLRYPLYGGWHIEWYHGYNVPLTSFVTKVQGATDRYLLECDLGQPIEVLAEKLVLHIVLPPGATNVKVESPLSSRIVEEKMFRRYTYLDVPWTARNVLSLELHDVLGETTTKTAEGKLRLYYTYSSVHVYEKPLTVSATLFSTLVAFMVWGRVSS